MRELQVWKHLVLALKFFNFYNKELKTLRGENLKRFAGNFKYLTGVVFYGITIDKDKYVGPYLRDGQYVRNEKYFRNFITHIYHNSK